MGHFSLIIDQGGHSSRAVVYDHCGELIAQASSPVNTHRPRMGWVEQNPQELIQSIQIALDELVAEVGMNFIAKIKHAGLVTQRSSIVCWHRKTGELLSPVISWQDVRARAWLSNNLPSIATIRKITGLYPNAHFGASKIRWCLDRLPGLKELAMKGELVVAPLAAFIQSQLCDGDSIKVDCSNAARTMLFNINRLCWDQELLDYWAIPIGVLPEVQNNLADWGQLNLSLSDGERILIPLRLVSGDQSAAFSALAIGQSDVQRSESAVINAGTGAFIAAPVMFGHNERASPDRLLCSLIYGDDQGSQFVSEGTVNGCGSALQWAANKFGLSGALPIDEWSSEQNDQQADIPLFINAVGGVGSPYWCGEIESYFVGEGPVEAKMLAVFESILFLLMENLVELRNNGVPIKRLVIAGGFSGVKAFSQKLADLSGLEVFCSYEKEATARGAVWLLEGRPAWKNHFIHFTPQSSGQLRERYRRWQAEMSSRFGRDVEG